MVLKGNSKDSKSKCYCSPKRRFLANAKVHETLVKSIASVISEALRTASAQAGLGACQFPQKSVTQDLQSSDV
jgi:hypothetical protein